MAVAILLSIAEKHAFARRTFFTPVSLALLCFVASQLISTFVGYDWYRSFWETHERMVGVFTVLHFVALFFAARVVLIDKSEWRRLWQWWLGVAAIVIGIGIIQKLAPNFLFNRGNDRVLSTLGNPIYLAAYGLFTFFLALRHVVIEKGLWQKIWIGGAVLGLIGIIISGGRGTMLGLLVGLFAMVVTTVRVGATKQIRKRALVVCLTSVCVGLLFVGVRQTTFIAHVPVLNRLATISTSDYTGQTRLLAWGVAVDSWKDYPIFGWGPGNFYYAL
jgi:O-antigen ligase